ncbi:solute carrier organic anion transporter family member 4A1-like [Diadema setosum]|uniref:solute carrier organic anion transporter family member 4A1-like n=1 Tax=Diadema setosum TaxID=31175 RepID=UPI003B3BC21E
MSRVYVATTRSRSVSLLGTADTRTLRPHSQSFSGSCSSRQNINKGFDYHKSITSSGSLHSLGESENDNVFEMKVRPSLCRGDLDAMGNAAVGEKLATSSKSSLAMAAMGIRNGSKVYAEELPITKSSSDEQDKRRESTEEKRSKFGFLWWRPACIQVLNNPKGYLVFLCLLALIQNMTVLGYLNVVITTLERRFRLTSVRSGFIVTAYDISNLIVCAFVTYFGERGHKPKWVGVGSILFSIGSAVFCLPHFLAGKYQFGGTQDEICPNISNTTSGGVCDDVTSADDSMLPYYWLFITGQVLHGWGGSTLYTLGITYMDDGLSSSTFGLYMGIFTAMNAVGPALGYILGGAMLSELYMDVLTSASSLGITANNPVWVGAWWLGFMINAVLLFVIALIFLGFPENLPVSKDVLLEKRVESQDGCDFQASEGFIQTLREFPVALWNLVKNIPFLCICGMATTEWFVNAGLTSFGPKYFESQFNMSAGQASNDIGIISVMAGIVGAVVSGLLMKKLDLSMKGLLKLSLVCAVVSLASQFVFIFHCPNVPFAGVTVPYGDRTGSLNSTSLTSSCHGQCACSETFDPVCGADNVLYNSPCHAGCAAQNRTSNGVTIYTQCTCIADALLMANETSAAAADVDAIATRGRCSQSCSHRWIFYIMMFISFTSTTMLLVPAWTATVRCVAHSLRGFALGLQTVMYGALGTVPAPVIFGLLIDRSCLLWETGCDGSKSCWLYNNQKFSRSFLLITVLFKSVTFVLCVGALYSYRPTEHPAKQIQAEKKQTQQKDFERSRGSFSTSFRDKSYTVNT